MKHIITIISNSIQSLGSEVSFAVSYRDTSFSQDRKVVIRNKHSLLQKVCVVFVLCSVLLTSSPFSSLPFFEVKEVKAAYSGKHTRTVEYTLGSGAGTSAEQTGTSVNNSVNRTTNVDVYAGSSWHATKASAGTKNVELQGSGIRVISAYLNYTASASSTAAVDVTDIELALDVSPGLQAGTMMYGDTINTSNTYHDNSGVAGPNVRAFANVTAFFQTQSDSDFNNGLSVVGLTSITGPTHNLMTLKLIITYEQDYSETPHTETKTVRFPLDSTNNSDTGSRQTDCAAASTCSFTYTADMPDLNANADIQDVWFEIVYTEDNRATSPAATTTIGINGGSAGVAHKIMMATNAASLSNSNRFIIYRPSVGGANFATGTPQQLDIAVAGNDISALGGELVVTYNYSTGAVSQTETIQYWMNATTALPGTATTTFAQTPVISNAGFSVKNLWFKIYAAPTATSTITASTTVGTAPSRIANYLYNQANVRNGELVLYHDMSQDAASFDQATTSIQGQIRQSTTAGDSVTATELFITFTWSGSGGGDQTKTVKFYGANSSASPGTANKEQNYVFPVRLAESVQKTYASSYLKSSIAHTDATTVSMGTIGVKFSGNATTTFSEATEDTEGYTFTTVTLATSTEFTSTSTIPWNNRMFNVSYVGSIAEEYAVSSELVITYKASFAGGGAPQISQFHYRWRNDDGGQATGSYTQAEDVAIGTTQNVNIGDRKRIRMVLRNTGGAANNYQFRLEHSSSSCSVWIPVPNAESDGSHFAMDVTAQVANATPTTDLAGLTNPVTGSFVSGYVMTSANQTPSMTIPGGDFTEVEYSVRSTSFAQTGLQYCFRVTNAGNTEAMTYTVTPQITLSSFNRNGGNAEFEAGASGSLIAGGGNSGTNGVIIDPEPGAIKIFSTEFNGSNGSNADAPAPELGSGMYVNSGEVLIQNGRAYSNVGGATLDINGPFTDFVMRVRARRLSSDSNRVVLIGRFQSQTGSSYDFEIAANNEGISIPGLAFSTYDFQLNVDYIIELVIKGNTITGKVNGETVLGPVTDSSVSSGGRARLYFGPGGSSTTGWHYDLYEIDQFPVTVPGGGSGGGGGDLGFIFPQGSLSQPLQHFLTTIQKTLSI